MVWQYNNISISSQKCRFPYFQCKFPEVKQADYQEGQQHGTARGLEFTSHRHLSARAHLQTAFGADIFDLILYTYLIWCARIWCAGSTCAQERGCADGGYLVCTEAQKSTRKRTRAHRPGSVHPVLQRKCCQQLQTGTACLSRETKHEKNIYIRYSASRTTLNHQLAHFI